MYVSDVNTKALKKLNINKYEGKCIGLANGKVIVQSTSIAKVMNVLNNNKFNDRQTAIVTFPKKDKVLVL